MTREDSVIGKSSLWTQLSAAFLAEMLLLLLIYTIAVVKSTAEIDGI